MLDELVKIFDLTISLEFGRNLVTIFHEYARQMKPEEMDEIVKDNGKFSELDNRLLPKMLVSRLW